MFALQQSLKGTAQKSTARSAHERAGACSIIPIVASLMLLTCDLRQDSMETEIKASCGGTTLTDKDAISLLIIQYTLRYPCDRLVPY